MYVLQVQQDRIWNHKKEGRKKVGETSEQS